MASYPVFSAYVSSRRALPNDAQWTVQALGGDPNSRIVIDVYTLRLIAQLHCSWPCENDNTIRILPYIVVVTEGSPDVVRTFAERSEEIRKELAPILRMSLADMCSRQQIDSLRSGILDLIGAPPPPSAAAPAATATAATTTSIHVRRVQQIKMGDATIVAFDIPLAPLLDNSDERPSAHVQRTLREWSTQGGKRLSSFHGPGGPFSVGASGDKDHACPQ